MKQFFCFCVSLFLSLQNGKSDVLQKEPTYLVVAPTMIRPNQLLTISAKVLKMEFDSFTITGVVRKLNKDGKTYEEICGTTNTFTRPGSYDIKMRTREQMSPGNYSLRVAGYSDPKLQGQVFVNDTALFFDAKQVSVFIQTSKPFYKQGQTVRFRLIPIQTDMMPVATTMDVKIKDPNGYVIREFYSQHTNAGGVVSLSFPLSSNLLAFGDWTIQVDCLDQLYNKTFRVQEFYPPLFYVNVSMPTFMLRNSFGLSGLVASNHTTGRGTKGDARIVLEIKTRGNNTEPIEPIEREINQFDSRTDFLFTREELEQRAGGGPDSLIGKELKVTAYVRDWFYNTTSSGFQSCIVYDEDVRLKFLGGSVWTFKPDLPFKVHIAAVKSDGSPLDPYNENRTINLIIQERRLDESVLNSWNDVAQISRDTSVAEYWVYPKISTKKIIITARYRNKDETRAQLVATSYWSPNKYFIQLSTPTKRPTVGEYMVFNVKTNTFVDEVYYHIVAGGNILVSDTLQMYSRNKLFSVALSREMAPSARIIAYFVANDAQVIADSLNFHVNSSRLHEMTVKFNRGKELAFDSVEITATADPLSYVAFSAIEYQLHTLGARNGLTWEEVYNELYSYDGMSNQSIAHYWKQNGQLSGSYYAPTPSFAHDANTTFYYSGLYIFTDANASAVFTHCNRTEGNFPCMNGLTCYTHVQACNGKPDCSFDQKDEMGCNATDYYLGSGGIRQEVEDVRLYNDDSLWRTKHIGAFYQDGGFMWQDQFTKPNGRIDIRVKVPTFPTTWVVSAFAMSRENGLAILPIPARFDGVRPMYISVQGPPRAKIGEHVSLRVSVFNFWDESLDILLTIPQSEDYNFVNWDVLGFDHGEAVVGAHQILVPVFPGGNRQVNIPIRPLKFGHVVIPVYAHSFLTGHTVNFHTYIEHYGVPEQYITNYQVDLRRSNSEVLPDLFIPVNETLLTPEKSRQNYVPGSPKSKVYVMGDIVGVTFFPFVDYDLNSENLLRKPYGSGSEAIFNFAANVYTLKMLRSMSSQSPDKVNRAMYTLNIVLQEMMYYMQSDGSFLEFRWSEKPSTWLTAQALQVLAEGAKGLGELYLNFQVPAGAASQAAIWLSKQQNSVSGAFMESNYDYNRRFQSTMEVDVKGVMRPANISLTSLCVLSLTEATNLNAEAKRVATAARGKAVTYLINHAPLIEDPFELAITAYALLVVGDQGASALVMENLGKINRTEGLRTYFSTHRIPPIRRESSGIDTVVRLYSKQFSNVTSYAVATTGYAMLAYMQNSDKSGILENMQRFLQEQHMYVGGFSSTQDSLVAMRALIKLTEANQDRQSYEMSFIFESDQDAYWRRAFTIDNSTWFDLQTVELPSHWGSIQASVRGHGVALVQMETTKNHQWREQLRQPPDNKMVFDLGPYNRDITTSGFNHSYIDYNLCPRWVGEGERSGMAVLEISIPSGYVVHNNTLKKFVQTQRDTTLSTLRNAEFYNSKAVFYFDYLDNSNDVNCATFNAFRWYPVANISEQHFIRVFEYYEPGNFNYTFYEKVQLNKLTVCLVCGSYQCPFCPHFAAGTNLLPNFLILSISVIAAIFINSDLLSLSIWSTKTQTHSKWTAMPTRTG